MRPELANRLRTATRHAHEQVDRAVALTQPVVDDHNLIRTWQLLFPICAGVEAASPPTLPWGDNLPRSAWLKRDLERLGSRPIHSPIELPPSQPGWMGWHYVVEGSTLGSAHLTRHLASVRPDLPPDHYFARNQQAGRRWAGFLQALARLPDDVHDAVVAEAVTLFDRLAAHATESMR